MEQRQRAHPRYATSLSVDVYAGDDVLPALATNLSLGGLGMSLKSEMAANTHVGLSLFLVEDGIEDERTAPLNLRGRVVWCTASPRGGGYMAGVQFEGLQPAEGQRIQEFLRRLTGAR
jgi:c-di-GMP-binding flagellar brake protein YcgR